MDKRPFILNEYISSIRLSNEVLEHLQETNENFENYFKKITKYDEIIMIYIWLDSLVNEIISSNKIEGIIPPKVILKNEVFFDSLQINHQKIHKLHSFILGEGHKYSKYSYRDNEVKVSSIMDGLEKIDYAAPKAIFVNSYMDEFVKFYRENGLSILNSSPFIKSFLVHLLFVRIHPYGDGNGRTARMLHNMKFTELINKLYKIDLKISPLNLSLNINLNKITYSKKLNDILFRISNEENEAINKWFNFMLIMADEQLYFAMNKLERYDWNLSNFSKQILEEEKEMKELSKQMHLSSLKKHI